MTLDHATRRTGIGGSDIPVLLGLSRYKTAMDLYLAKTGEAVPPSDQTEPQEWGHRLEPVILQKLKEKYHLDFLPHPGTVVARDLWAHALYTPDAVGVDFLCEAKSRSAFTSETWGAEGTVDIPADVYAQVQWGLGLLHKPVCYVGVLIGGSDFRSYVIPYDAAYFMRCLTRAQNWWSEHIVAAVPPPLDGGKASDQWLTLQHPTVETKELAPATPEQVELLSQLLVARDELALAEKEVARLTQLVKAEIGSRSGITASFGYVTWYETSGRSIVDWKAVAEAAAVPRALIEKHTTKTAGGRVFRVKDRVKEAT